MHPPSLSAVIGHSLIIFCIAAASSFLVAGLIKVIHLALRGLAFRKPDQTTNNP